MFNKLRSDYDFSLSLSLFQKELPQYVLFLLPFVFFGNILFWRREYAASCRSVGLFLLTFNVVLVTVGPTQKARLTNLISRKAIWCESFPSD